MPPTHPHPLVTILRVHAVQYIPTYVQCKENDVFYCVSLFTGEGNGKDNSESDSASVITVVVPTTVLVGLVAVVTVVSIAIYVYKMKFRKSSNLCTNSAIGLVTGEPKFVFPNIRADGGSDVTQSQVVLEVEGRCSTTMEAGEGEEIKYASVLTSTSGIRPPTVEKPMQYHQIDLDATKVNQFTYMYTYVYTYSAYALAVLVCCVCA